MKNLFLVLLLWPLTFAWAENTAANTSLLGGKIVPLMGEKNWVFSPYSVYTALSLLYPGARGKTSEEIKKLLEITNEKALLSSFQQIQEHFAANEKPRITSFQSAWIDKHFSIEKDYQDRLEKYFQAQMLPVSFSLSPQEAANQINAWVKEKTEGEIEKLLEPGTVKNSTTLVLINTTFFESPWQIPFFEKLTTARKFHNLDGTDTSTKMMETTGTYTHFDRPLAEGIALPYFGQQIQFIVVKPKKGIRSFVKEFSDQQLKKLLAAGRPKDLKIQIPKFSFTSQLQMKPLLQKLGLKQLFSPQANLSGISSSGGLQVSDVIHQAKIEVTEKGTKAAAATAVMTFRGHVEKKNPIAFIADEPFLFAILDKSNGMILFMGVFSQASAN